METKAFKLVIMLSVALMFSLIALNNVIDYCTNFQLVKTVLSMDSISSTNIQWRAITNPRSQHAVYLTIISWEILTALVCWIGAAWMVRAKGSVLSYSRGKTIALTGLTMGLALFMIGFVIIAGEWFYLWDSLVGSMHSKAILLTLLLTSFIYFISRAD